MRFRFPVRGVFALLCVVGIVQGQTAGVTVTGVVLDSSNATVPEARVTLQRNGAVQYSATSDGAGAFRLESVAPGAYIAEAEHDGFKPTIARLRVGSRSPAPLVFALVLADVKQELSVRGDATQVSTNTSENLDSVALDRQMLDNLPVFDQDYIGTMSRFLDAGSVATSGVTLIVDGLEGTRAGVSASARSTSP